MSTTIADTAEGNYFLHKTEGQIANVFKTSAKKSFFSRYKITINFKNDRTW